MKVRIIKLYGKMKKACSFFLKGDKNMKKIYLNFNFFYVNMMNNILNIIL